MAPEVLVAVDAIPAHLAGRFRESRGFSQAVAGHFLIFDRRAHTVFGIDEAMSTAYPIVEKDALLWIWIGEAEKSLGLSQLAR